MYSLFFVYIKNKIEMCHGTCPSQEGVPFHLIDITK